MLLTSRKLRDGKEAFYPMPLKLLRHRISKIFAEFTPLPRYSPEICCEIDENPAFDSTE
jgi:hypothetical protein